MKEPQLHTVENTTINILLWGKEGVGKTYLASSMPKPCMYLAFDPNALNGVNDKIMSGVLKDSDVPYIAYDESDASEVANSYKCASNPFNLNQIYEKCPFKTLVLDSLSSFSKLALQYGVELAGSWGGKEKSTIERPGLQGYGIRSTAIREMTFNVVRWCRKHGVNTVFIAHEGEPIKDESTGMLYRSLSLTGGTINEIGKWFDEAWYLGVNGQGSRKLLVKPQPSMRPLKSRMFGESITTVEANSLDLTKLVGSWQQLGKINQENLK